MPVKLLKKIAKPIRIKVPKKRVIRVVCDPVTEEILAKEQANEQINRRGRIDGAKGLPRYTQKQTASAELEIRAKFETFLRDSMKRIGLVISKLKGELEAVTRIHNMFETDPKGALKEVVKGEYDQLDQELAVIDEEVNNKVAPLVRERDRLEQDYNSDVTQKRDTEDTLKSRPRKKSWFATLLHTAIMLIGIIADIFVTYNNMQKTGITTKTGSIAVAFVTASFLAAAAHFLGKAVKTRDVKSGIIALLAGVVLLSFIARLGADYGSTWIMVNVNLAAFLVIALSAYRYTSKKDELAEKYFADEKAIRKGEKKLKKLDTQIGNRSGQGNQDKLKLTKSYEARINQRIAEYQAKTMEDYNIISQGLSEWGAYEANVKERHIAIYHKQVFQYRNFNNAERRDRSIPLVKMWEDNYVEPLRLSSDDADSAPKQPASKSGSNGLMILLLVSIFSLGSCNLLELNTGMETESTEVAILLDETEELTFDVEATTTWLFNLIGFDTNSVFKPTVAINVSGINNLYTNRIWRVSLPKGGGFNEITNERLASQQAFYKETIEALRQYSFTEARPRSKLYRPICDALNQLQQSQAEHKIEVVFSDMFENTKYLSLYNYQNNPEKLLEDRDSVTKKLEAQCALPDLTGIEIYIIHQPSVEMDELFDAAKRFWKSYFEEKGATVYFLVGI